MDLPSHANVYIILTSGCVCIRMSLSTHPLRHSLMYLDKQPAKYGIARTARA